MHEHLSEHGRRIYSSSYSSGLIPNAKGAEGPKANASIIVPCPSKVVHVQVEPRGCSRRRRGRYGACARAISQKTKTGAGRQGGRATGTAPK